MLQMCFSFKNVDFVKGSKNLLRVEMGFLNEKQKTQYNLHYALGRAETWALLQFTLGCFDVDPSMQSVTLVG